MFRDLSPSLGKEINLIRCLRGAKPLLRNYLPLHAKNTSPYYGEGDKGDRV